MGLGTLAVSIYSLVTNRKYEFITGNDHIASAVLLIIVGTAVTLVAVVGIVGAMMRKRLLLLIVRTPLIACSLFLSFLCTVHCCVGHCHYT